MPTLTVSRRAVLPIVNATFPDYRRKTVWIDSSGSCSFYNLNWDGGSRNQYRGYSIGSGLAEGSLSRYNMMAPWDPRQIEGQSVAIPTGHLIVKAGTFCGKPATMVIYCHPADMPRLLPSA